MLPGPVVLETSLHSDERGHFFEAFNVADFQRQVGASFVFVQDNQSRSRLGVVRGLHYQLPPLDQGKLVRVIRGEVFDVVVDVRRSSGDFGVWRGYRLSEENHLQLWVPPGYAHGFLALADPTDVVYKVTAGHSPMHERSIRWDDPQIGITWPLEGISPVVSAKDAAAPSLSEAEVFD